MVLFVLVQGKKEWMKNIARRLNYYTHTKRKKAIRNTTTHKVKILGLPTKNCLNQFLFKKKWNLWRKKQMIFLVKFIHSFICPFIHSIRWFGFVWPIIWFKHPFTVLVRLNKVCLRLHFVFEFMHFVLSVSLELCVFPFHILFLYQQFHLPKRKKVKINQNKSHEL